MPDRFTVASPVLSVSGARALAKRTEDVPFRILVLGDFSGRENRGVVEPVRGRPVRKIDLDNFDAVLARMAPALELELAQGEKVRLSPASLEDFHPDRIWLTNSFFAPHRGMRAELSDPSSFAAAMASVAAAPPAASIPAGDPLSHLPGLDRPVPESSTPAATVAALIRDAVASHRVAAADPRQPEMLAAFDAAVSGQMRSLLHHPHCQALEAAWRSVDFLLRNLDTDDTLEVSLLDVSLTELTADLRGAPDPANSGIADVIAERMTQTAPWSVVAGLFEFHPDNNDADLLSRMTAVAALAGVPFIASGGRAFVVAAEAGTDPASAGWRELRESPQARHAGLVAPRFLLRQPYGRGSDETDFLGFEEVLPGSGQGGLLWGNGAIPAALLLATAWRDEGWDFSPPAGAVVSGLPVHVRTESGERTLTPCGEILLTDRVCNNLLDLGIMPLASVRNRDAVRLIRFQSITRPPSSLAGW